MSCEAGPPASLGSDLTLLGAEEFSGVRRLSRFTLLCQHVAFLTTSIAASFDLRDWRQHLGAYWWPIGLTGVVVARDIRNSHALNI